MDIVDELRGIANLSMMTSTFNNHEDGLNKLAVYRAALEIERLRKMVKDAYNSGFIEGGYEHTKRLGGIPWSDCKYRKHVER